VEGGCVQPISFDSFDLNPDTVEVETFSYTQYVDSYGLMPDEVYLIPLDPECKVPAGYEDSWGAQTVEVDSGRLALARTTDYVIEDAYNEAVANINLTTTPVTLDAAGRLVLTLEDADGLPYLKTVDSPRENLAMYQRIMLEIRDNGEGCLPGVDANVLGDEVAHLGCGADVDDPDRDLLRAASFLAGAADKSGNIGIDEVVYINNSLEINTIEESSTGSLLVTGYFDFKDDFGYLRYEGGDGALGEYYGVTAILLQPPDPTTNPDDFENGYPTYFSVVPDVPIYANVFGEDWDGRLNGYPIVNFVRAADDAVTVINYIHNYELPEYLTVETVSSFLPSGTYERGPAYLR
jgi:hypothetical protein